MHTTNLRKVGGSIMLSIPPAILELLHLEVGATIGLSVDNGKLILDPMPRTKYTLSELLASSDFSRTQSAEDREWLDAPATGRELI